MRLWMLNVATTHHQSLSNTLIARSLTSNSRFTRCTKGSLVSDKVLRFDFAQPEAITKEQLSEIETLVNQKSALTSLFKQILWILIPQKQRSNGALWRKIWR